MWPTKSTTFSIWHFTEKFADYDLNAYLSSFSPNILLFLTDKHKFRDGLTLLVKFYQILYVPVLSNNLYMHSSKIVLLFFYLDIKFNSMNTTE